VATCRHRPKGRKHRSCQCPLWVEGTLRGEKIRRSLDMLSWEAGQDLLRAAALLVGLWRHAHRFRDTFTVSLLEKGVALETVAILLGNTIKIGEKHYAPWARSREIALEEAVRRSRN
jgi:integrase